MGLSSIQIFVVGSERRMCFGTECIMALQGHPRSSKVIDFGDNQKRVCYFLLVINIVTLVLSCPVSEILLKEATLPLFHVNFGVFTLD